jgi:hypothetical protein
MWLLEAPIVLVVSTGIVCFCARTVEAHKEHIIQKLGLRGALPRLKKAPDCRGNWARPR